MRIKCHFVIQSWKIWIILLIRSLRNSSKQSLDWHQNHWVTFWMWNKEMSLSMNFWCYKILLKVSKIEFFIIKNDFLISCFNYASFQTSKKSSLVKFCSKKTFRLPPRSSNVSMTAFPKHFNKSTKPSSESTKCVLISKPSSI